MSPFMKYHRGPPPHKYDIIYMEKVWSHFCLMCVLHLWTCFFPKRKWACLSSLPQGQRPWSGDPRASGDRLQLGQKKEKIDGNKSQRSKAEMKWKITSLVCGFDLCAYNGTGFPSALGTSVGTCEMGSSWLQDPHECWGPSTTLPPTPWCAVLLPQRRYCKPPWCVGCTGPSSRVLRKAEKVLAGCSNGILKVWSSRESSCSPGASLPAGLAVL